MEVRGVTHLKDALLRMYIYTNGSQHTYNNTTNANSYGHSLCTISSITGRIIIPAMVECAELKEELDNAYHTAPISKLVMPVVPSTASYVQVKRTADPLIGYLLGRTPHSKITVNTVKTATGERYYGRSGYILDKCFVPLVIFGSECKFNPNLVRYNPVCVINPEVFQRDDIVSKYIVKKVIPYLSDYTADVGPLCCRFVDPHMKTIITPEITKFIESPVEPIGNINAELWKCAKEYFEEIVDI